MNKNILILYIELIENPFVPKSYKNLALFYKDINMQDEYEAFMLLSKEVDNNANTDNDTQ